MKINRISLTVLISAMYLLTSCQKVIELNLSTAVPAIVIQGNVFDHAGPYVVTISKTVNFNLTNNFPPVTTAKVSISDNVGNTEVLSEVLDGTYITSVLRGVAGRTYTLTVENEGQTYVAKSTMPMAVNIDSMYLKKSIFGNRYLTTINFRDPNNIDNYYRVIQSINDTLKTGINIANDELGQGLILRYSLSATTPTGNNPLKIGDNITIQLECIDKNVYEYFRTSRSNNGQSASPANPVSNLSNGALGYFSACTVREASIVFNK